MSVCVGNLKNPTSRLRRRRWLRASARVAGWDFPANNDVPVGMDIWHCPGGNGYGSCENTWKQPDCTINGPLKDAGGSLLDGATFDAFKGAISNPGTWGTRLRGAGAALKEGTATFWFGIYTYGKTTVQMGVNMVRGCE